MRQNLKLRRYIYMFLLLTGFLSFILSFAINNIVVWGLLVFYVVDKKQNLIYKLKVAWQNHLIPIFILFFLCQVIGILYSTNTSQALDRVLSMAPLLFIPMILVSEPLSLKDKDRILKILKTSIPSIFLGLLLYHLVFEARELDTFVHFALVEGLGVSQFYLAFIISIPLLTAIDDLQKKQGILVNLLIIFFSVGLLVLLKNLTSLIFLIIIWGLLITRYLKTELYRKALVLLLLGGILLTLGLSTSMIRDRITFLQKTTDLDIETIITKNRYTITKNTLEHRLLVDYLAVQASVESVPFGWGTGDVQDVLNDSYQALGFKAGMKYRYNTHNQYLEEFMKTGLLGGLTFLFLVFFLSKTFRITDPYFPFIYLFFVAGCMVESYLNRQHGVFILGFIIPFFINRIENRNAEQFKICPKAMAISTPKSVKSG